MTRLSRDEIRHGRVWNGFDYQLQVWVKDGFVLPCSHPASMRAHGTYCCNRDRYAGQAILTIAEAEQREDSPGDESPDPLTRILDRMGYIVEGELEQLPAELPVVIKLASGDRERTTAGQAPALIKQLGGVVAEVYLAAEVCQTLRAERDAPRPDQGDART